MVVGFALVDRFQRIENLRAMCNLLKSISYHLLAAILEATGQRKVVSFFPKVVYGLLIFLSDSCDPARLSKLKRPKVTVVLRATKAFAFDRRDLLHWVVVATGCLKVSAGTSLCCCPRLLGIPLCLGDYRKKR